MSSTSCRSSATPRPGACSRGSRTPRRGRRRSGRSGRSRRGVRSAATRRSGRALDRDWERMVTFYAFPREHWKHLRTSNPVESPFAAVRLRTAAAKRFKKVENATAVIWKTLLIAEKTFRRLDAPELLADVATGVAFVNGVRAVNRGEQKAAA